MNGLRFSLCHSTACLVSAGSMRQWSFLECVAVMVVQGVWHEVF